MRRIALFAVLAMSILHLLNDLDNAIHRVHRMLKPGGIFVSSTACLGDSMAYIRFIAPIGKFLRLIPSLKVFTRQDLESSLIEAGFHIDYQRLSENDKLVYFLLAVKQPHAS